MRQHLLRDGRPLAYLDSHPHRGPQAGDTPNTVLLLHAFPLNADMWEPQLAAVPPGWRFVAPDLAGFGESAVTARPATQDPGGPPALSAQGFSAGRPSFDEDAEDLVTLLDHLSVDHAVVAGLSMGGYLAFALYRRAASRISGLVLANTKATADSAEARVARQQMLSRVTVAGVPAIADEMLPKLVGETSRIERPELAARVRDIAARNSVQGVRRAIACMMGRPDSSPLLARVACPALVIAADEDAITPPDVAREMVAGLPSAELVVLRRCGHLSNLERPTAFNDALLRFLSTARC